MTDFAKLLLFLAPLAYSPGPGNLLFAALGARFGLSGTRRASAGYHVATLIVTLGIGFGMGTAVEAAPGLFPSLKLGGALYLLCALASGRSRR